MNLYAIFPLIAFFANLILGVYIIYKNPKANMNIVFALFLFALAVWSLGDFFVLSSETTEAAVYWNTIGSLGSFTMPAFLLHFFFIFTKNEGISKKVYIILLYIPALSFLLTNLMTDVIVNAVKLTPFGYSSVPGPLYNLLTIYAVLYVFGGLLLCYKYYLKTPERKRKTQAKLILFALFIPSCIGLLTLVIFPIIGVETMNVTSMMTTISAVIIAYAIIKYGLMSSSRFSIRNKLIVMFLLVSIIPVTVTGFFFLDNMQSSLIEEIHHHLETAVHSRADHIETWLTGYKQVIKAATKSRVYKDVLDNPDDSLMEQKASGMVMDILEVRPEILKISILDENGIVVISSDKSALDVEKTGVLSLLKTGRALIVDAHLSKGFGVPCIDYGLPILNESGQIIGGVIIDLDLNLLYEITQHETGLGETGEIYMVNKDMYMITPSRTQEDTFLKQEVDTINARNCFRMSGTSEEHESHDEVKIFDDYRGVSVLGTHAYISDMEWCLLAEIDESEALAPLIELRSYMILYGLVFVLLVVGLATAFSRSVSAPIIKLTNLTHDIGKGNLDVKVEIESKDELGELASAFNKMVIGLKGYSKQIKHHAVELEETVKERTRDLETKIQELSETKIAVLNMMEDTDEANRELVKTQEDLKKSLTELKVMDIKKDQFISIAAHELKTPLTSIHGFSQLLQNKKVANNFTKRNSYLKIMDHETKRLAKLVTDILDLSRIDLHTIRIVTSDIDMKNLIDDVKKEMDIPIKAKGLKSEYIIDKKLPQMLTDPERLTQILINLINNAVKYTPKGKITVDIHINKKDVHFVVKDTGIGIAKAEQEKVFERFYQVDSSYTRKAGGTGLGLALTKEFVELLGGRIWVESEEGKGSEFHFKLPIKGATRQQISGAERNARKELKKSITAREKAKSMGFGSVK